MVVRRWCRVAALGAATMLAGLALASCNESRDSGSASTGSRGALSAQGAVQAHDTGAQAPDLRVDQRSIVYTGTMAVRVDDVDAAAARATAIATAAGGFVGGDTRDRANGSATAELQLRVPAPAFADVVKQLAALGQEEQRGIRTEDVTEQTVDLDARIATQQARVVSGRQLLSRAKNLNDLVMLEREVATRESDLASLQAKKRRLADLTALSTITLSLHNPVTAPKPQHGPPGFLASLSGSWHALTASFAVLLTVLGALLPWIIVLGLPAWGITWLVRRYGGRTRAPALAFATAPAAAPAPTAAPAPAPAPAPASATAPADPGGPAD